MMRVLVIGSGGREHALAWRLAQSASVTHVISAPGSDALRGVGRCFDVDVTDHGAVGALCDQQGVGLVVIGPEAPRRRSRRQSSSLGLARGWISSSSSTGRLSLCSVNGSLWHPHSSCA